MSNIKNISIFVIFIIMFCLFSCTIQQKKNDKNLYDVDIIDYEFILTKQDSIELNKIYARQKKFADSCKKYNLVCNIDHFETRASFKHSELRKFRQTILDNFNVPKRSTKSVNKVFLTIGKNDSIKSYDIPNIKDKKIKKEIQRVLNLGEMNKWKSANIMGIKCDFIIEFDIYVVPK